MVRAHNNIISSKSDTELLVPHRCQATMGGVYPIGGGPLRCQLGAPTGLEQHRQAICCVKRAGAAALRAAWAKVLISDGFSPTQSRGI